MRAPHATQASQRTYRFRLRGRCRTQHLVLQERQCTAVFLSPPGFPKRCTQRPMLSLLANANLELAVVHLAQCSE